LVQPAFHVIPPAGPALKVGFNMINLKEFALPLLGICSLVACSALSVQVLERGVPNQFAMAAAQKTSVSSQAPTFTKADIDRLRRAISNWGRWGANDELGAVNLITPAKRNEAARLVKEGIAVSLAHNESTDLAPDNNHPLDHKMLTTGATQGEIFALDQYGEAFHGLGMTHLDALAHMMDGGQLYNGFSRNTVTDTGAENASVLALKDGIFTRGVLFDIPRLEGKPYLDLRERIYPADLDRWAKEAGISVEPGDVVLIRTGRWARREKLGPWNLGQSSPGLDVSCAVWLHKHDIAVLGSDVESDIIPSPIDGVLMPVHLLVLNAMGMPIVDNMDLERVAQVAAEQHRWVFLLTLAPEAVPGGTGSPINPTAIF
jgi:kynurenine formamidase